MSIQDELPNAILLNEVDNVVTATRPIAAGKKLMLASGSRVIIQNSSEYIDTGHKIAIAIIKKGELVIKFGETIGEATKEIRPGENVHSHNMKSLHGRPPKN
jgi:altronate dehydratase small subunit